MLFYIDKQLPEKTKLPAIGKEIYMKRTKNLSILLTLVIVAVLTAAVVPVFAENTKTEAINEAKASFSDLYEAINPSVVYILVGKDSGNTGTTYNMDEFEFDFGDIFGPDFERFFRDDRENEKKNRDEDKEPELTYGSGTGFVWDEEGHIVTNNHVIEDGVEITVTYSDGIQRDAKVIGADPDSDLAVLAVENPKEGLTPVTMGDSSALKPGDLAAAIGNPLGQNGTMTQGIISALGRSYSVGGDGNGNYTIPDVIQTDASINPGNSGGVLINVDGEVVGVVMAFSSYSYSSAGIGYAIPGNLVKRVIPALIENGEYQHPWIGMSGNALTPKVNELMELDHDQRGALIVSVTPGSPADKAGIRGGDEDIEISKGVSTRVGGDIITKINDRDVKGMDDIIAYLSSNTSIGDTITLHVLRDGEELDLDLTLAARPNPAQRAAENQTEADEDEEEHETGKASLGVYLLELDTYTRNIEGLPEDTEGVVVQSVIEDSAAEDAGIEENDVITKIDDVAVSSIPELKSEINNHLPGERVTLTLIRDGETKEIRVTLGNTLSR